MWNLSIQSFIGKMKFGVSKILPNSLSKWLSPKVDGNNGRRRRHEEIESDESDTSRGISLLTAQQTAVLRQNDIHSTQVPPSKKQRTILVKTKQFLKRVYITI